MSASTHTSLDNATSNAVLEHEKSALATSSTVIAAENTILPQQTSLAGLPLEHILQSKQQGHIVKNGFACDRTIDYRGLTVTGTHPQEKIVYALVDQAQHRPTRALFIGNVRKPVDALQFQNHLRVLVKAVHATFAVERVWMNRSRTHALVVTNCVDAAKVIRVRLNGTEYPGKDERVDFARLIGSSALLGGFSPPERKLLRLFVDFIRPAQVGDWTYEEDYGPRTAVWRVDYRRQGEYGEVAAEHTLLEGDFRPLREMWMSPGQWVDRRTSTYIPGARKRHFSAHDCGDVLSRHVTRDADRQRDVDSQQDADRYCGDGGSRKRLRSRSPQQQNENEESSPGK